MAKRKSFASKLISSQQRKAKRAVRKAVTGSGDSLKTQAKKRTRKALTGSSQTLKTQAKRRALGTGRSRSTASAGQEAAPTEARRRGCVGCAMLPLLVLASLMVPALAAARVYLPLALRNSAGIAPTLTVAVAATATSTPTSTASGTWTCTPTATGTWTPTRTWTATWTRTSTMTPTRTNTVKPTATRTPTSPPAVCPCYADVRNCSDFATQAEAQACYDYCMAQVGYDVHRLDSDGDGEACESLP